METKTCKTCRHFCQHYTRAGSFWLSLNQGHCIHPRFKERQPDDPACRNYFPEECAPTPISLKGEFSLTLHDVPPELTTFLQNGCSN